MRRDPKFSKETFPATCQNDHFESSVSKHDFRRDGWAGGTQKAPENPAEAGSPGKPGKTGVPREAREPGETGPGEAVGDPRGDRGRLNLTDPKAIRALAHLLRWALLEALGQAGTLTATQASEMLGESPANCAFHLRTLAKYGFVEEAGGGRGRERPWRQTYNSMSWRTRQEDP